VLIVLAVLGGLVFLLLLGAIALASALTLIAAVSWAVRAPIRVQAGIRRRRRTVLRGGIAQRLKSD
jgi:hypothetical protein